MSLAQIGEFAFVLLSRASNLKLVQVINHYFASNTSFILITFYKLVDLTCLVLCGSQGKLYLLLLGTTALSLVILLSL